MKLNPNLLFLRDNIDKYRIIAMQGGTRSGKTYSALQFLIEVACQFSGLTISICRNEYATLKATAMLDFFEILKTEGLYNEELHNKTDKIYYLNGNLIEFFGLDEVKKVHGRKRHILYVNEANEGDYETWKQLMLRTSGKAIIDYNPSMFEHWIYEHVLTRPDCGFIKTNHHDNPHLTDEQRDEIERYKAIDYEYYRVYGLGERGKLLTGAEFYHGFRRGAHVKKLTHNPALPVHLSFDFNVVPYMTMLCAQVVNEGNVKTIRIFREYCMKNPDNSTRACCKAFKRDYAHLKPYVMYYGDSSGKNRIQGQGNKRNFDDVESELLQFMSSQSDQVLSRNPNVFKRRDFINMILAGYWPDIKIEIDESCTELIKDLENLKTSIDGKHKEKVNDKALGIKYEKYGHTSDALDYLICTVLYNLYKATSAIG